MSNTNRTILIGSLVGAALGGLLAWAYLEFTTDEEAGNGSRPQLQLQADAGDMLKLGFALIPVVRLLTNLFVPVEDTTPASSPESG